MPDHRSDGGGPLLLHGERLRVDIERPPSGGGEKFHPLTIREAVDHLTPQAELLARTTREIPDSLRGPRVIFQATLLPNYLAASYFPSQLFAALDLVPIGSRTATATHVTATSVTDDAPTKSIIVAGSNEFVTRLERLLAGELHGRTSRQAQEQLREIAELRLPSANEVLRPGLAPGPEVELPVWEAVLHPGAASRGPRLEPIDQATFEKLVRYVTSLQGQVVQHYRREVGGLTFVPIRLDPAAAESMTRFNPLRALRPLPPIKPPTPLLRTAPRMVAPPAVVTPLVPVRIAVFDGGADVSDGLYPTCTPIDLTTAAEDPEFISHGSAVTGAVLYGNITDDGALPAPATNVDHFRIFPVPEGETVDSYWLLDQIENTLQDGKYRIVNLSLGPPECVEEDNEPNRWTSTLDQLAYEQDILFVVAAGNNGREDAATGLNRIQAPADMVNGLSVGACLHHAPDERVERALYSAIGPGRWGCRSQPIGVQFGGDIFGVPFHAVLGSGRLAPTDGTSFAAPLVTHSMARLTQLLGEERATLNNCRAIAVHFTDRPAGAPNLEIGHGRLQPEYDSILQLPKNVATALYQDEIERADVIQLALPVPLALDRGNVEISWTLSITAPTEATQPTEYTQATLEVVFRPHDQKFRLTNDAGRAKIVNVVEERVKVAELYSLGYTAGERPVSFSMRESSGTEQERREGGKWETVRHASHTFQARSLHNPCFELSYLAREGGLLTAYCAPLAFSLVVTVRAKSPSTDVYQMVRTEFPLLTPLELAIRAEARI